MKTTLILVFSFLILLVLIICFASVSTRAFEIQNPRVSPVSRPQERRESVTSVRVVTGYSAKDSCHYPKNGGCLTASGKLAKVGYAACPRAWKFGTKVEIAGTVYTCQDRLAKRYDSRIDIWMDSHEEAVVWGKKRLEVRVLK